MAKEEEKNDSLKAFPGVVIALEELQGLDEGSRYGKIARELKNIYKDNLDIDDDLVNKVASLIDSPKNSSVDLPNGLKAINTGKGLVFKAAKNSKIFLIIALSILALALGAAIYFGVRYFKYRNVNIDIDGDGIADINIDLDGDGKPDINIDTNGDNKPDLNIDYKGNHKAIFNIDTDNDGKPDKNLVNKAGSSFNSTCKINCDIDGDGKPDLNVDTDGDGKPDKYLVDMTKVEPIDKTCKVNCDLDGDGKPDVNIDSNNDGKADENLVDLSKVGGADKSCKVNCDINGDGKPDVNVDTNNDGKPDKYLVDMSKVDSIDKTCKVNCDLDKDGTPDYNIDTNKDGKADDNLVEFVTNGTNACKINCDINGDGWPDTNLDVDGDGKADSNLDYDGDGLADGNIDLNGDGICDMMCDTNGDGKCDSNCIKTPYDGLGTGSSTSVGDPTSISETSMLVLRYNEGETVNVDNIIPTDQPYVKDGTAPEPYKSFSIENLSVYTLEYNIVWKNVENTFTTDNLKYKVTSTNGGFTSDFKPVPKKDGVLAEKVLIAPNTTQEYRFDFRLFGTGANQNEDQGKTFSVLINIET